MPIPIIDLFAGPGGLAEGFSRFEIGGKTAFQPLLSIEKDSSAHRTLTLRAFYRQFRNREIPAAYHQRMLGLISTAQLFEQHPVEASAAQHEAWLAELGSDATPVQSVRDRVAETLGNTRDWVLLGGPPCQAYSLAGRSRNRGITGYVFEQDHKTTLYLEYLQLISDFWPAVFVMENVKGLLSAKRDGASMFERILDDLADPATAIAREGRNTLQAGEPRRYDLFPLAVADSAPARCAATRPADYVICAEQYGIPQARHRVIVVGVRRDFSQRRPALLQPHSAPVTVRQAIADLPCLRSGLSRNDSPENWAATLGRLGRKTWRGKFMVCRKHQRRVFSASASSCHG